MVKSDSRNLLISTLISLSWTDQDIIINTQQTVNHRDFESETSRAYLVRRPNRTIIIQVFIMASSTKQMDKIQSFLDCSICFHHYDAEKHTPIMFECQHSTCKPCLQGLLQTHARKRSFPCPICRAPVEVKRGGLQAYTKSWLLLDLLQNEKKDTMCAEHPTKAVSNICFTCKQGLCSKCVASALKNDLHSGHDVEDIEEAYARMDKVADRGEELLNRFIPLWENYQKYDKRLAADATAAKEEIRKLADNMVAYVRTEQKRLETEINNHYESVIDKDVAKCDYSETVNIIKEGIKNFRQRDTSAIRSYHGITEIERFIETLPLKELEDFEKKKKQTHTVRVSPSRVKFYPIASVKFPDIEWCTYGWLEDLKPSLEMISFSDDSE